MYKVIGHGMTRAFRVIWALEELGQPYEVDLAKPGSPTARAASPTGKVPVLRDGDAVLTDSVAIMTYLADKHGDLTYPAGTLDRAHQDGITQAVLDEVDALLWTHSRHTFVLPEDQRVPDVIDSLKGEYARNIDRLAARLDGDFLAGDRMTIADILATHCLNWGFAIGFPPAPDTLKAYGKDMRARPAYQRAWDRVG